MASFPSNRHLLCLALLCARVAFAIADASDEDEGWTRWAVLVAGSSGFWNYRHQADVCHAYQLLRKGGLEEDNIVVFMYDDLANNTLNPRPGVIINNPKGEDVYAGVPKDYVGKQVTTENLFAVLLGDKKAIKGGSGKVVNSKPNDRIFIYYSDHGGPGVLGMPNKPYLYAGDFIRVLKQKKESNGFMKMVIYVESCESGSIFDGLLSDNLNIYVTTASNATESSWGTYCPGTDSPPPPEYETCLGDLYSVAWMEDSEMHNLKKETISKQYKRVRKRTLNTKDRFSGSHVMEYGTKSLSSEKVYLYQGFDPCNSNASDDTLPRSLPPSEVVNQRDADLLFLWRMYERSDKTPEKKREILREITETVNHRLHLDNTVDVIGNLIFGGPSALRDVRPSGTPLVDDWDCLKSMVRVFEFHCGVLTQYGMKHMRAFANICNRGISKRAMERACVRACGSYTRTSSKWSPSTHGYSA